MKKTMWILISILLGFLYVIGRYLFRTGYLNYGMLGILFLAYCVWVLMIGIPSLVAFGFQLFTRNASKHILIRLIPSALAVAAIIFECIHPFYGIYLNLISLFLGFTPYLAIPMVLAGLLAGWLVKPERSVDR